MKVTDGTTPTESLQDKLRQGGPIWSWSQTSPCEKSVKEGQGYLYLQKSVSKRPYVEGRSESLSCVELTGTMSWNASIFTTCLHLKSYLNIKKTCQSVNVFGAHLKDDEGILAERLIGHQGHLVTRHHLLCVREKGPSAIRWCRKFFWCWQYGKQQRQRQRQIQRKRQIQRRRPGADQG